MSDSPSLARSADARSTAPLPLPSHSPLHGAVLASWVASKPSDAVLRARAAALDKVRRAVATYTAGQQLVPPYELALFGSVAIDVDDGAADLDLSILDPDRPSGYLDHAARRKDVYDVYLLTNKLERVGLTSVVPIPHASTPIVKCRDPTSEIELDIRCALRPLCILGRVEPSCRLTPYLLAARVRQRQQPRRLPEHSSYSLILLCTAYLQSKSPPVTTDGRGYLPNLQDPLLLAAYNVPRKTIFIRRHRRRKDIINTEVNATFVPAEHFSSGGADGGAWGMPSADVEAWRARSAAVDLGALVHGFFKHYAGGCRRRLGLGQVRVERAVWRSSRSALKRGRGCVRRHRGR